MRRTAGIESVRRARQLGKRSGRRDLEAAYGLARAKHVGDVQVTTRRLDLEVSWRVYVDGLFQRQVSRGSHVENVDAAVEAPYPSVQQGFVGVRGQPGRVVAAGKWGSRNRGQRSVSRDPECRDRVGAVVRREEELPRLDQLDILARGRGTTCSVRRVCFGDNGDAFDV